MIAFLLFRNARLWPSREGRELGKPLAVAERDFGEVGDRGLTRFGGAFCLSLSLALGLLVEDANTNFPPLIPREDSQLCV